MATNTAAAASPKIFVTADNISRIRSTPASNATPSRGNPSAFNTIDKITIPEAPTEETKDTKNKIPIFNKLSSIPYA